MTHRTGWLNVRWLLAAGLAAMVGMAALAEPPEEPGDAPAMKKTEKAETPAKAPAMKPAKSDSMSPEEDAGPTPEQALAMLKEGNERWVSGTPTNPNTGIMRRKTTAESGQKPFATILTCADSRLPVERIFDRGVGDLFVLRVAGNVIGTNEAGTIEYGTEHLHTPVLVVMGHTKCGAVTAVAKGDKVSGNVATLVAPITPAVQRAKKSNPTAAEAELINAAIRENVWQSMFDLFKTSPEVCELVRAKKVIVVGAVCDVSTGKVEWLGEHPWQDALIDAIAAKKTEKAEKVAAKSEAKSDKGEEKPAAKTEKVADKGEKSEKGEGKSEGKGDTADAETK